MSLSIEDTYIKKWNEKWNDKWTNFIFQKMFARAAVFNKIAERRKRGENVTRMKREYNEMYLLHHS